MKDRISNLGSIVLVLLLLFAINYTYAFSNEISEEKAVVVFVDAFTGELVVTNHVNSSYEIQLFDLTGKEVFKVLQDQGTPTRRIQTSELRKGIYLVRVTPASNTSSVIVKVMIR